MANKIFRFLTRLPIGIILLLFTISSTLAFKHLFNILSIFDVNIFHLAYGILGYGIFHLIVWKPDVIYVFAHESSHALAAILCGVKVSSFKVGRDSGHVRLSKTNHFIELAPYFTPFYTICLTILYFGLSLIFDLDSKYYKHFVTGIGVTIAFHIVMTIDALKANQPDLHRFGIIYSLMLIYILNLFIMSFAFCVMTDKGFYGNYVVPLFENTKEIFLISINKIKIFTNQYT